MKLRRIGLYGINCTGKTTVAKKISELHPNYEFIDGSDIINKICQGGLSEFKKLNTIEKYNVREAAINYLKNYQNKIKKHLVIAGHYSFLQNDNSFEVALTHADVQFYTDIFIFNDKIKDVIDRCNKRNKTYKPDILLKWSEIERKGIIDNFTKSYIHIIENKEIKQTAIKILEEINKQLILEKLNEIIETSSEKTVLLFDADGTIISDDSGKYMGRHLSDSSTDTIRKIFKKYPEYTFEAFMDVATHYSKNNSKKRLENAFNNVSNEIKIRKEFLELFKIKNTRKIIVSAGFSDLWKKVLNKYNIHDIEVISGNTLYDDFIVGDKEKGYIVDYFQNNGKKVIAIGDGLVDRYMLEKSDFSFLIVNEKLRSITKFVVNKPNIKYFSYNGIKIKNLEEVNFSEIIKIIKKGI